MDNERIETLVIGGSQAGLSTGYHLRKAGVPFTIVDAHQRVGDAWRSRWDSLRVFSPASIDGLPGMPFPAPSWSFPTKDELADYLETYARHYALPIRTGVRVTRLGHDGERFIVEHQRGRIEADNVIVASGHEARPNVPAFAGALDPALLQIHSSEYRRPSQLRPGGTLIVGAGNSGAEIAVDVGSMQRVWLSGRYRRGPVGPSRSRLLSALLWPIVTHVLTIDTPLGRRARAKLIHATAPVERVTLRRLADAGVEMVPRTAGVCDGLPVLEDGRVMHVANVIWCTGYRSDLDWIDLPILDAAGEPAQSRGVVAALPGLYFVGRFFQYAFSSHFIGGVGRDAGYVVRHLVQRRAARRAPARRRAVASARNSGN